MGWNNSDAQRGLVLLPWHRPGIFSNVDLSATMESRICIVGENGAGKTTLLKMVMEMEGHDPTKGTRTSHRNLKFGYFTQHFVDQLDMTVCPVEIMQKEFPGFKVEDYRRMLGQFGVTGDKSPEWRLQCCVDTIPTS